MGQHVGWVMDIKEHASRSRTNSARYSKIYNLLGRLYPNCFSPYSSAPYSPGCESCLAVFIYNSKKPKVLSTLYPLN